MILTFCKRYVCLFLIILTLVGCGSNLAPVTELTWQPYSKSQQSHRVQPGETLYAIAFRYDTDYRTLAYLNHLRPPFSLRVGQVLNLRGIRAQRSRNSSSIYPPSSRILPRQKIIYSSSAWLWPVRGRVVTSFIPTQGKKGINISCKKNEKVIAAAAGVVAYAGSGLAGYGNLIIIKHSNEYLTAYGNNARILVSEGHRVKAGQIIARAGIIDRHYPGIHFEIRKAGMPVNPLNYLGTQ